MFFASWSCPKTRSSPLHYHRWLLVGSNLSHKGRQLGCAALSMIFDVLEGRFPTWTSRCRKSDPSSTTRWRRWTRQQRGPTAQALSLSQHQLRPYLIYSLACAALMLVLLATGSARRMQSVWLRDSPHTGRTLVKLCKHQPSSQIKDYTRLLTFIND